MQAAPASLRSGSGRRLDALGAVALVAWGALAWVGRQGHPPLAWFLGLMAVGSVAWWWADRLVLPAASPGRAGLWRIGLWALAFRLVGLWGEPVYEDDHHRFLWDGYQLVTTGDPYGRAPAEFFADPTVPARLARVLSGINNPDLPTVYGPAAEVVFGVGAWLAPGRLGPLRGLGLLADLAVLGLLARMAGPRALLLYGWCPLVIKETAFTVHPDGYGALGLVAMVAAARAGRPVLAGIAGGLAMAVKPLGVLGVVWCVRDRRGWPLALAAVGAWGGCAAPFLLQGGDAGLGAMGRFAREWEFNPALLPLLRVVLAPEGARAVLAVVAVAGLAGLWLWQRRRPVGEVRADLGFGWLLLCAPVVNPWYLLWLAPFVALQPSGWGRVALLVAPLAYITGRTTGWAGLGPYDHPGFVRWLEYGAVAGALGWAWWRARRAAAPAPAGR